MESTDNKIESKVKTSSVAAVVTPLVVMFLIKQFPALASMSDTLEYVIAAIVTGVVTFVVGYVTKHTHRPTA